ncbi:MAG: response regulator transcription factor [Bacteroidales bacterium]|jgi:DNA-binding response OmpR family regulator|nr:response regulator transcription factor [Bacteroidales bacterium]
MSHRILIVDDDKDICEILEINFANEGFDVTCAYSAEEALKKITADTSLILLDVMMGGMSGYKMAETLRKADNHTPIIFITAKDTENDMLTGFSVGGDDYISKPFSIKEVIARVKAVLKRGMPPTEKVSSNQLTFDNFCINLDTKELRIDDEKIALTKTEFELLVLLAKKPDRVFSREDIINKLWRETPYITERTIDVHIARLRKKLGNYSEMISNRSGFGYRFLVE